MSNDKNDKDASKDIVHIIKPRQPLHEGANQDAPLEWRQNSRENQEVFSNKKSLPNENTWKMQAPDPWAEPKDKKQGEK